MRGRTSSALSLRGNVGRNKDGGGRRNIGGRWRSLSRSMGGAGDRCMGSTVRCMGSTNSVRSRRAQCWYIAISYILWRASKTYNNGHSVLHCNNSLCFRASLNSCHSGYHLWWKAVGLGYQSESIVLVCAEVHLEKRAGGLGCDLLTHSRMYQILSRRHPESMKMLSPAVLPLCFQSVLRGDESTIYMQ